jgi:chitinase
MAGGTGCEFFDSGHPAPVPEAGPAAPADDGGAYPLWVDLYYPGWRQDRLPPDQLDLSGVTHIIHFAWLPWIAEGGTDIVIDDEQNGVGADSAAAIIQVGHAAGKKVLIAVGGSGRGSQYFNQAMQDDSRAAFIQAIIAKAVERGYDGIDIDWEPQWDTIMPAIPVFQQFSRELRAAIDTVAPHLIMTSACLGSIAGAFGAVGSVYDQVNIMTYDLVYGIQLTWHNSAVSGGSGPYYSVQRAGLEYENAGIPKRKIGVGLKCGGYSWQNATGPLQDPMGAAPHSETYASIMQNDYSEAAYHWDDIGQVPYLSVASSPPMFVTYDDARSSKAKIDFVRSSRYGGLIIWDSSEQYFPNGDSAGQKNPLLDAVKQAALGN